MDVLDESALLPVSDAELPGATCTVRSPTAEALTDFTARNGLTSQESPISSTLPVFQ